MPPISFQELQDERIAKVIAASDASAINAIEAAKMLADIDSMPKRGRKSRKKEDVPKRVGGKNRSKDKAWVPFYAHIATRNLIEQMARDWNVSVSTVLRLCVAHTATRYGYPYDPKEVLLLNDRKALKRSNRVRRPFTPRVEALASEDRFERLNNPDPVRPVRDDGGPGE